MAKISFSDLLEALLSKIRTGPSYPVIDVELDRYEDPAGLLGLSERSAETADLLSLEQPATGGDAPIGRNPFLPRNRLEQMLIGLQEEESKNSPETDIAMELFQLQRGGDIDVDRFGEILEIYLSLLNQATREPRRGAPRQRGDNVRPVIKNPPPSYKAGLV